MCDRTPCKFLEETTTSGDCPRCFYRRAICRTSVNRFRALREILRWNPRHHLGRADAGRTLCHGLRAERLDERYDKCYASFGSASCEFGGAALAISQSPERSGTARRYHLRRRANLRVSSKPGLFLASTDARERHENIPHKTTADSRGNQQISRFVGNFSAHPAGF